MNNSLNASKAVHLMAFCILVYVGVEVTNWRLADIKIQGLVRGSTEGSDGLNRSGWIAGSGAAAAGNTFNPASCDWCSRESLWH